MGVLQGVAFVTAVLLVIEISPVFPIPQRQVDNRIVNRPQGALLVPNNHNQGNNMGQSQPGIHQQNFQGSSASGAPSRPNEHPAAQAQQNFRDPQTHNSQNLPNASRPSLQTHPSQNLPNTHRPSRPPHQGSFVPEGTFIPTQSQPNDGRPQTAPAVFEPHVNPEGRQKHPSCGRFPSPGQCQAAFPRYYYNASMSQCECYIFGGCDEEEGSYRTLQECHQKCLPERREEGPSCKHVYIENFHPEHSTTSTPFPSPAVATHGPSFGPSSDNGHNQPFRGRPDLNSPENTRPQAQRPHGNISPNGGSAFQGSPNAGTGTQNFNAGSQNSNNGSPNFNSGSQNFNNGSPNINSGSPNFSNGQRIPSLSTNGHPITNQPPQGSQAFGSLAENGNPGFQRAPGNKIPNTNPTILSEDVRFPVGISDLGVIPFVQPRILLVRNH